MPVQIRAEGPSLNQKWLLDEGATPVIVGRDPASRVHLPDPDRLLSRRHLSISVSSAGVQVTVLSSVNGASTSQGELAPGQSTCIALGGYVSLGSYTIHIEAQESPGNLASIGPTAEGADPFAALFGGVGSGRGTGADPFDALGFHQPPAVTSPTADPFAALSQPPAQGGNAASPGLIGHHHALDHKPTHYSRGADVYASPPLSPLSSMETSSASQVHGNGATNIDDWLGIGSGSGSNKSAEGPGWLATDHVHDQNLPLLLPSRMAASSGTASAASSSMVSASAANTDPVPLGGLESGWNARSTPAPSVAKEPELPIPHAFSSPSQPQELDFDALFGGEAEVSADPFSDPSWFTPGQLSNAQVNHSLYPTPAPSSPLVGKSMTSVSGSNVDSPFGQLRHAEAAEHPHAAAAFARGLGLAQAPALDEAAWERMGGAIRLIISGLIDLLNARAELKRELRVEDRTMLASRDNNPLKTGIDIESALRYLLISQDSLPGFKPAEAALREAVDELIAHELATMAASRAVVEGALREFDPKTLRKELSPAKSRLPQFLDSSRMWDAYVDRYAGKESQMADWLERMFSRHFVPAYSRECERLKMQTAPQRPPKMNR